MAHTTLDLKQQQVAALLKRKPSAADVVETTASASVFASEASVMVAATGNPPGLFGGLNTGTMVAGAAGLLGLGLLAANANDDDDNGGSPSPSPSPGAAPSPAPSPTPGPGNSGNTGPNALVYTLTTQTDNLLGGAADEQFIGDAATATAGDTLNGGAGTDTVKLFGVAGVVPNISNIENAYYFGTTANVDISTKGDVKNIELDNSGGKSVTIANGQSVTFSNTAGSPDIIGNTVTGLNLTLNNVGAKASAGGDSTVDLKGTAVASVSIAVGGTGQSFVTLANTGGALTTINVAAKQAFDLQHALTTVTTIDASASTASVDVDTIGAATNLSFTGGSANDRIVMLATLTGADKLNGAGGTDTLSFNNSAAGATNSLAATVAGTSGFEVIESVSTTGAQVLDLAALNARNSLSGLVLSGNNTNSQNISNLNAATAANISILQDMKNVDLASNAFLSGGTADTATITLDNSGGPFGNGDSKGGNAPFGDGSGVDVTNSLTFAQADVLNVRSLSDGTSVATERNSITGLDALDLNKLVVTGDNAFVVTTKATSTELTEVDASGLVLPGTAGANNTTQPAFGLFTDGTALTSLLVRGSGRPDFIDIDNATTKTSTVFTGGGSDVVSLASDAAATHTLAFTAAAFSGGDIGANQLVGVNTTATPTVDGLTGATKAAAFATAQVLTIDFSAALEALLKSNNVVLGTSAANVTLTGQAISATTNINALQSDGTLDVTGDGVADAAGTMALRIDINGDGAITAGDDWVLALLGSGSNDTMVYNAANDVVQFTVVVDAPPPVPR